MPGMPGFPGASAEEEESPFLVVAVLEVDSVVANYQKKFEAGLTVRFRHRWGSANLKAKTLDRTIQLLKQADGKPLPTVARRFQIEHDAVFKGDKASVEQVISLARWALEHGLVSKCAEMLDKAAELDKNNLIVSTYLKVKADLNQPPDKVDAANAWKGKLLEGYRVAQADKHHCILLHNLENEQPNEVQGHLDRLESSYRAFYYWWALRGVAVKVPRRPLVAVLTDKEDDFKRLQKILAAGSTYVDSFFARRENLAIYSAHRNDPPYNNLEKVAKRMWEFGFNRTEIVSGKPRAGVPKAASQAEEDEVRAWALILKTLEYEWETTSISHNMARQLLFSSELLPRNVAVPEWIQFGLGSFFETPLQSPWGSTGAPSAYWLPRYKELSEKKKFGSTPYQTLVRVVTDGYFRRNGQGDEKKATERTGRAASWALTYYLAQKELDGLRNYFTQLAKMPRDLELDDAVLLECFARAFDCMTDDHKQVSKPKLTALAHRWDRYVAVQPLEAETIHKAIREAYASMHTPPPPTPGGPAPGGFGPGSTPGSSGPGGINPGMRPRLPGSGPRRSRRRQR